MSPPYSFLRKNLRACGVDIIKWNPNSHLFRRIKLYTGVDHILDVGANVGQFARLMRSIGYRGRITSFEPLSAAYNSCQQATADDRLWEVHQVGLSDSSDYENINIASNSVSSSVLKKRSDAANAYGFTVTGTEQIKLQALDDLFDDICTADETIALKIDAQGFEPKVLRGAERSLPKIRLVQMEIALEPAYEGEWSLAEALSYMAEHKFEAVSFEPGHGDKLTGKQLELDLIFLNKG